MQASIAALTLAACGDAPTPTAPTVTVTATDPAAPPAAALAPARFEAAPGNLGLDFVHTSGADGRKLLPETMGPGCVLFDANGDTKLDLFITNGAPWPDSPAAVGEAPGGSTAPTGRLYVMERGRFVDRTEEAGLAAPSLAGIGQGVCAADYDGDGDLDLFVTYLGPNKLLQNDGGRFTDVTERAGVAGGTWTDDAGREHHEWSTSATFVDVDGDGWLDLFVCNYLEWSLENDVELVLQGETKGYASPKLYKGSSCRLYRNRGDATFEDVTESSGVFSVDHKALGVNIADIDRDGRMDLLLANDTQPNCLFLNRTEAAGAPRFEDVGKASGVGYGGNGAVRAGMGIDVATYCAPGELAIAVGNFAQEPISFFRSLRKDRVLFSDDNVVTGLGRTSGPSLTFAAAFVDANLDGYQDLLAINGHLEPDIHLVTDSTTYRQRPQLFLCRGPKGTFVDASGESGGVFERPIVGRSVALGDLDGDFDIDAVVAECGGPAHVWLNQNPSGHQPLRLMLLSKAPNTYAIGAEVRVSGGPFEDTRWVRTGSGYLSQHELALTFGLGAATRADVRVRWPNGETSEHLGLEPGRAHVLRH
ncbi:MAG: CRTAC1 family protein [Planctomycetota bacterium]